MKYTTYSTQEFRYPNQNRPCSLSFCIFASVRTIECRYRSPLEVYRYLGAMEPQGDGRPCIPRGSTCSLTFSTTSPTRHARQQSPNRWEMRRRCVKCIAQRAVKLEVYAENFERFGGYEAHSANKHTRPIRPRMITHTGFTHD